MSEAGNIQGIYENIIGVRERETALRYWAELGYQPVKEGRLEANQAESLYGIKAGLTALRLQNGATNTHGMLRLWLWDKPLAPGLGLVRPLTVGSRWFTSRTADIMQLRDAYMDAVAQGEKWLVSDLVRNIIRQGQQGAGFYERFVGVREMMVLGAETRQVFFQRYGYDVPGYGVLDPASPLAVSEGTHMGIVVPDLTQLDFYTEVLGLKLENRYEVPAAQPDPRSEVVVPGNNPDLHVLMRRPGETYAYATLVTPQAKVGRIYLVMPQDPRPDMRDQARPGVAGLCLATYRVSNLTEYHQRVSESKAGEVSSVQSNEFGESSFSFTAPDGVKWALLSQ